MARRRPLPAAVAGTSSCWSASTTITGCAGPVGTSGSRADAGTMPTIDTTTATPDPASRTFHGRRVRIATSQRLETSQEPPPATLAARTSIAIDHRQIVQNPVRRLVVGCQDPFVSSIAPFEYHEVLIIASGSCRLCSDSARVPAGGSWGAGAHRNTGEQPCAFVHGGQGQPARSGDPLGRDGDGRPSRAHAGGARRPAGTRSGRLPAVV